MKKINYNVTCDNTKLKKALDKDKNSIYKRFTLIVSKRRELECYENSRNEKANFQNAK